MLLAGPAPREAATTSYKLGDPPCFIDPRVMISVVVTGWKRKRVTLDRNRCPQPQPSKPSERKQVGTVMTPWVGGVSNGDSR